VAIAKGFLSVEYSFRFISVEEGLAATAALEEKIKIRETSRALSFIS
jgi:hypothetical protein